MNDFEAEEVTQIMSWLMDGLASARRRLAGFTATVELIGGEREKLPAMTLLPLQPEFEQ